MTKERLAEMLEASGTSQEELAKMVGLDNTTISRYVNGSRRIPEGFARKAEAVLKQKALDRIQSNLAVIHG